MVDKNTLPHFGIAGTQNRVNKKNPTNTDDVGTPSSASLEEVRAILRGNEPLDVYLSDMRRLRKCPSLSELRAMKARGDLPDAKKRS